MQAAEILSEHGIESTVINARFAKPLDTELILPLARRIGRVVTLEEGCLPGGFGTAMAESLMDNQVLAHLIRIGVPDILVDHAKAEESLSDLGLTGAQIADRLLAAFQLNPIPVEV